MIFACDEMPHNKQYAEEEAHEWARTMGYEVQGLTCMDLDTDHNGYVTCTMQIKNNEVKPYTIECAKKVKEGCGYSQDRGCRIAK